MWMGCCCLEGKSLYLDLEYNNLGVSGLGHENLSCQG